MLYGTHSNKSARLRLLILAAAVAAGGFLMGQTLPDKGGFVPAATYMEQPDGGTAASQIQIERFDVKKGQVVGRVEVTKEMQKELRKLAQSASGSAGTFRIDPADGTVLHFPLRPALEIRQPGFFALAAEAYVFLPAGREPYILFFSEENEPRLFALKHPVKKLLALCGWEDAYAPGQ